MTQRKEAEERLRLASQATTDAIWDWDIEADTVWWNEGLQTLFGYSPDDASARASWWLDRLRADDREAVRDSMASAVQGRATDWSMKYRFRKADVSHAFVLDRGFVIRDGAGTARRMIGAMTDVTRRRLAEQESRLLFGILSKIRDAANRDEALGLALEEIGEATGWVIGQAWVDAVQRGVLGRECGVLLPGNHRRAEAVDRRHPRCRHLRASVERGGGSYPLGGGVSGFSRRPHHRCARILRARASCDGQTATRDDLFGRDSARPYRSSHGV